MKTVLMRYVKVLALLVSIVLTVLFLQNTLFYYFDGNYYRLRGFYREPENSLDVVLLGASDISNGFSPGYAYDYSGLTSYLYSTSGNRGSQYLSQVKEVLAKQRPQMLIFEVHGFLTETIEEYYKEVRLRYYVENIPMSMNKLATIIEHDYDDRLSFIVPFFKYHSQWTEDFDELRNRFIIGSSSDSAPSPLKGYGTSSIISSIMPYYDVAENDETIALLPDAEQHLIELLEYLQTCGVENILFTRLPHQLLTEMALNRFLRSNRVEEIVTSYGFDFLDLEQNAVEMDINYEYDFSDADHLNFAGQMKLTEYLCDLMLDEYGVEPMPQTDENQQQWEKAVAYTYALQEYSDELGENGEMMYLSETPELLRELELRLNQ